MTGAMPDPGGERPLGVQISRMLKARGVDLIFGIPGVHNQELYRGIDEAGITHVLARHEQGAGFMADGYARATGRPGVVYVITGPGLTNLLTPLGQAYSDAVPVLAISSCLDDSTGRRGQLHQMRDQRAAAACVCAWSEEARSPQAAYALIDRALAEFATRTPRPRHLQLPIALLAQPAAAAPAPAPAPLCPAPDPGALADLARRLRAASRPLAILGGGARAAPGLAALLAREGIASFTSYAGRGLVPAADGLHFGATLARPASAEVIAAADLVLAIGTDLAEVDLWRDDPGNRVPVDWINLAPPDARIRRGAWIAARAEDALPALAAALRAAPAPVRRGWAAGQGAEFRARARAEIAAERPGILPVAEALRAALPAGTMIYSDMTQFAYAAKEVWEMDRPGHWHHPTGFGTLGYALPAAIGGALGRPGLPTLCIAGDYGFQYTLQELGTAAELGLNLPIILWDNGKLGEIEDSMTAAQIAPRAVVQRNPDFALLARAYGLDHAEPARLSELEGVIAAALAAPRPTLIRLTPALSG